MEFLTDSDTTPRRQDNNGKMKCLNISAQTSPAYLPTETAAVRHKYGLAAQFLATFAPSYQTRYCADLCRVYTGTAPTLLLLKESYGSDTAESWLMAQLEDLADFAGCREKLTPQRCDEIAQLIMARYGYLKVTMLMHFFLRFKLGEYGEFYGAVDPMRILSALRKFDKERMELQQRYERESRERTPKLKEYTCTFEEHFNSLPEEQKAAMTDEDIVFLRKWFHFDPTAEK